MAEKNKAENKAVIKRILTHIKRYRFLVGLSFICAAISVAATLYAPILTGNAIDLIVEAGKVDFEGIKGMTHTSMVIL